MNQGDTGANANSPTATTVPEPPAPAVTDTETSTAPATAGQDANTGSTSKPDDKGATDANPAPPKNLLDVVKRSTKQQNKAADAPPASNGEAKKPEPKPAASTDEPKAKDSDEVPFHNHPRWKQVLSERDSAKADAAEYGKIKQFQAQTGLTQDEMSQGFAIMALIKQNPLKAREALKDINAYLDTFAGEVLPEDLKKRVDDGVVDQDTAKELARTRSEAALEKQHRERAEQEFQRKSAEAHQQSLVGAVNEWEQNLATRDPDYGKVRNWVTDRLRALHLASPARTPAEAVAMAERAYNEVMDQVKQFVPPPKPAVAPTTAVSSGTAVARPKTLLETVRLASAGKYQMQQ